MSFPASNLLEDRVPINQCPVLTGLSSTMLITCFKTRITERAKQKIDTFDLFIIRFNRDHGPGIADASLLKMFCVVYFSSEDVCVKCSVLQAFKS